MPTRPSHPDLLLMATEQGHPSTSLSTSPSCDFKQELHLDTYLLRYLKDCPKAGQELEQELCIMGCSAQINPEKGEVLVKGLAQTRSSGDGVKQWKAKVEKLFDRIKKHYICQFVTNLHISRALLQSSSSSDVSGDVRVYSDEGIVVVVGEQNQVHAMLRDLENAQVRGQVNKKKETTTCRLGEAKLHLLWEEIKHGLADFIPTVKVKRVDDGQLVLEGSAGEVRRAAEWVSEKEDHVTKRVISSLSPHLLTFLRNTYGAPGVLGAYLGVSGEVEIELGNTELCLLTLSSEKLDQTEMALHETFKELKIEVPNYSAIPFELRSQLESVTSQLNQRGNRAMVRFGGGSIVHLLGNCKEVDELKELISQFILDKSNVEGTVPLPFQELRDHLPELLQLHGFDHSGVALRPVVSSSGSMVMLTGPSREVTQVRNRLGQFLGSLSQETFSIDQPGAQHYFHSPTGKAKVKSVCRDRRCLIQLQSRDQTTEKTGASGSGTTQERVEVAHYDFHSGLQLRVCQGDITKEQADALVNAANMNLEHAGGVAAALSHAGGPQVQKESRDLVRQIGRIPTGDVVVTTGGRLNCKKILHAVGPIGGKEGGRERALLEKAVQAALNLAETMQFQSIAIPCISSGIFGVPMKMCAEAIVTAVRDFGSQRHCLNKVTLIDFRGEAVRALQEACDRLLHGMCAVPTGASTETTVDDIQGIAVGKQPTERALNFRGFTDNAHTDQAPFYRPISSTHDTVTVMLGAVMLQLVCGDITKENTDVIVNTTDFSANPSGVSKAILTAAGPSVQAELAQVGIPPDQIWYTWPGSLHCAKLVHVSFNRDTQRIRKMCGKILNWCEGQGYHSIAFPAINTGAGGMDFGIACTAMLDGMATAVRDLSSDVLSLIRIVVLPEPVFLAFRSQLESRLGQSAPSLSLREKAMKILKKIPEFKICSSQDSYSSPSGTAGHTLPPVRPPPAVFCVVGCMSDIVLSSIRRDLETILQEQLLERQVPQDDFQRLNKGELETILAKARALGVSLELGRAQREERVDGAQAMTRGRAGAGAWAGNGQPPESRDQGFYMLRGLKEDVLSVNDMISEALKGALKGILREKDEAQVAYFVQWSMQSQRESWRELSPQANYLLEKSHQDRVVSIDVKGPHGTQVKVNLRKREATDWHTGLTYRVKRKETPVLDLPNYWDPMGEEIFKKVKLLPNSIEYQRVAQEFQKTANQYNILQIERVQNLYLWQAYAVCHQRLLYKNGPKEVGEKILYHGTGAEACNRIEKTKFDRGFTGAHGSLYGKGVYFAVSAVYSAMNFSPADSGGLKRLYVARVLTGRYTVGNESMKAPPPRSPSDPTDCFDSLVDKQQQPTMYVIFHDDQAYPEYLVTFK